MKCMKTSLFGFYFKIFQNGRPDTSACEDITPRNLCILSILFFNLEQFKPGTNAHQKTRKLKAKEIAEKSY